MDTRYISQPVLLENKLNTHIPGERCSLVVKALCYKPKGRGFDTQFT
jgi:hypothetical protein